MMTYTPLASLLCAVFCTTQVAAHGQDSQRVLDSSEDIMSDEARFWVHDGGHEGESLPFTFAGLNTFAALPYQNCFDKDDSVAARYDIAILGAPHDTTVTSRPGARYGPSGIRTASQQKTAGYSIYTGRDALHDWAKVVDCGDVPVTWLDNRVAIKTLDLAHRLVSSRPAANSTKSSTPRIVTLGGDHTTTLPALRSTYKNWGKVSVIHFDSHIDTWDPKVLGGNISKYAGLNHGTFLHIAHEENLIHNSSIHAGIRGPFSRPKGDIRNDINCGFTIITARDLDTKGVQSTINQIRQRVGDTKVYISVDIDVLDPAFAPATGTAEPGGWSTRELLTVLAGLEGLEVVGADVVEVAPIYDTAGETTTLAAAEIVNSLIDLMVVTPVKSIADEQ